jgi:hypothetical protein
LRGTKRCRAFDHGADEQAAQHPEYRELPGGDTLRLRMKCELPCCLDGLDRQIFLLVTDNLDIDGLMTEWNDGDV